MRYVAILLLLAGGASPPEKYDYDADELAKRNAEIRKRCDYMVGLPRNSEDYLSCIQYMEAEM